MILDGKIAIITGASRDRAAALRWLRGPQCHKLCF